MLTQLLMARAALEHMELDMDQHAALQCRLGNLRQSLAEVSDWIKVQFGSTEVR